MSASTVVLIIPAIALFLLTASFEARADSTGDTPKPLQTPSGDLKNMGSKKGDRPPVDPDQPGGPSKEPPVNTGESGGAQNGSSGN